MKSFKDFLQETSIAKPKQEFKPKPKKQTFWEKVKNIFK